MENKKKERTIPRGIRIDPTEYAAASKIAEDSDRSIGYIVNKALAQFNKKYKGKKV